MGEEEVMARWEEYVEDLYKDNRGCRPIPEVEKEAEGPPILEEEIEAAIRRMKKKKATGADNIEVEMLKAAGEIGIKKITELANLMYEKVELPEDLNRSIFIAIPKVAGTA